MRSTQHFPNLNPLNPSFSVLKAAFDLMTRLTRAETMVEETNVLNPVFILLSMSAEDDKAQATNLCISTNDFVMIPLSFVTDASTGVQVKGALAAMGVLK